MRIERIHLRMLPFRDHGPRDAPTIFLLLHFFGGSHREWDGVVALLKHRFRLVTADMAGFGEATALDGYTVADMADRILDLLSYLAPTPVILVGHSMSGKAAMVVAAEPPANLAAVVLVAPSPLPGEPMSDAARANMRIANTSRERAEAFTRDGFAKAPAEEIFETAVEDVLRSSDAAFHAWPDHGTREDWSDRVHQFRVPSLLVVGEHDRAIDPELQERETLPLVERSGGRMHVFADCAHLIPYEKPAELAQVLEESATSLQNGARPPGSPSSAM